MGIFNSTLCKPNQHSIIPTENVLDLLLESDLYEPICEYFISLGSEYLEILNTIHRQNSRILPRWFNKLTQLKTEHDITFNQSHIELILLQLQAEQKAPIKLHKSLTSYFKKNNLSTLKPLLLDLSRSKLLDLSTKEQDQHLLHHTQEHFFEISQRVIDIISNHRILTEDPKDRFLLELIRHILLFHDYETRECAGHKSPEQYTATLVADWIISALPDMAQFPDLQAFIKLLTGKIIILGTQGNSTHRFDLSGIYILLHNEIVSAGVRTTSTGNEALMRTLNKIMLITGLCDKDPASAWDNITFSHSAQQHNHSIMQAFFHSSHFSIYFPLTEDIKKLKNDSLNQDNFRIGLIPNICIQIELLVFSKQVTFSTRACQFIQSIHILRHNLRTASLNQRIRIITSQNNRYLGFDLSLIDHILTNTLESEINFVRSQNVYICFIQDQLQGTEIKINTDWTETETSNLRGLGRFYSALSPEDKSALVQEIMDIILFQPGMTFFHEFNNEQENTLSTDYSQRFFQAQNTLPAFEQLRPSEKTSTSKSMEKNMKYLPAKTYFD